MVCSPQILKYKTLNNPDYELLSKSVTDLITSNITLKFANHVNNNAIFSTSGEREFIFEDIKCGLTYLSWDIIQI